MKTQNNVSKCEGCRHHNEEQDGDYCYLFRDAPEELPCKQHDKFEVEQKAMTSLVKKRPEILAMMINSFSN